MTEVQDAAAAEPPEPRRDEKREPEYIYEIDFRTCSIRRRERRIRLQAAAPAARAPAAAV